jgi:sugar phosphate isomerase/epimerase
LKNDAFYQLQSGEQQMNRGIKTVLALWAVGIFTCFASQTTQAQDQWRLGMQAYSFNRFTFYEAVDKNRALGMKTIEAYPGQKLSAEHGDTKFDHNMSAALMLEVKQMLKAQGVTLVNYGVVGLPNDEAECRKVFAFAKAMGIETIVSEPPEDAFDLIDRLCQEYEIGVALHNHPKPSHYWDYKTVLRLCEGRSQWIGACADTGHWTRSGIDPVEAIRALGMAGRIRSLHFKDLNEFGVRNAHDVPWGQGESKAAEILGMLASMGFAGSFSIEYEHNWLNSMPEIAQCVAFFEQTAFELGIGDWQRIFNGKDLSDWDGDPRLWTVKDGVIRGETTEENPTKGNTFCIWRGGRLQDFELKLKFKIRNGNSGVQYRSKEFGKWRITGYQAEVENNQGKVGFLYHEGGRGWLVNVGDFMVIDEQGEKKVVSKINDQKALIETGYYTDKGWNEYHIVCQGNHVTHSLNGFQTMELIDKDRVTDPQDMKDRKGSIREGVLALQIHAGLPMLVEFKDIRVKKLCPTGDAVLVFNGENLDEWTTKPGSGKNMWVAGKAQVSNDNASQLETIDGIGELINLAPKHGASLDIYSKAKFGDCRIELEVMVPKGSNSGVYLMGEYEVQVLDSYGKMKVGNGDIGAIYGGFAPPVNASKAPGQWQQFVIDWRAPKFDTEGKKIKNAEFVKVELNGQILHKNLVMERQTPGGLTGKEAPTGPLMFQGNHGPVAYRNIVVTPLN